MPGPLMDRNEQYGEAPQVFIPVNNQEFFEYVEGQEVYSLPKTALCITAVQVYGYEASEPITRGVSDADEGVVAGQTVAYVVRMQGTNEEALITNEYYTATDGASTYNQTTNRVERTVTIEWQPSVGTAPFLDWSYPLGTPAPYIPLEQLPVAEPPTELGNPTPSYEGPIVVGNTYKVYTNGIVNATGAVLVNNNNSIDVTNLVPRPREGTMIVYYQSAENTLMDKT